MFIIITTRGQSYNYNYKKEDSVYNYNYKKEDSVYNYNYNRESLIIITTTRKVL